MKRRGYRGALLFLSVVLVSCGALLEEEYEEVARVGSESIAWGAVKERIRLQPLEMRVKASQSEEVAMNLLEKMIEEKLLVQEAKKLGFTATEEDIVAAQQRNQALAAQRIAEEFSGIGEDLTSGREEDMPQSVEAIEEEIIREKLIHSRISEERMQQYFEEHKEELSGPEKAVMRFIIVKDPILFEQIEMRLKSGQDFESLKKEFSRVPGFHAREDIKPLNAYRTLGVPIDQMKVGDGTKVNLPGGLKMIVIFVAIVTPYEQAQPRIYATLYKQLIQELKEKTPIEIKGKRLKELALSKSF